MPYVIGILIITSIVASFYVSRSVKTQEAETILAPLTNNTVEAKDAAENHIDFTQAQKPETLAFSNNYADDQHHIALHRDIDSEESPKNSSTEYIDPDSYAPLTQEAEASLGERLSPEDYSSWKLNSSSHQTPLYLGESLRPDSYKEAINSGYFQRSPNSSDGHSKTGGTASIGVALDPSYPNDHIESHSSETITIGAYIEP